MDARAAIRDQALALGFDAVGFASADIGAQPGERLTAYTRAGLHGDMAWMADTVARRRHPQALWPAARSIVVLGQNYGPAGDALAGLAHPDRGNFSVYARGRDYHDVVKKRLKRLARWMAETHDCEVKVFVDTAPVMEKPVAERAGLGWQGKHTNLVSRRFGSWLFLGSVFSTLDLAPDERHEDDCGSCRRCLDICPTAAFPAPYRLDARRCISYLTIEHKGHIAAEFRAAIGNRIYGCDDCLAVCPWNKFAARASEAKLAARAELTAPRLADLLALDDAAFREVFAGSPVKRTGRDRFMRNVLIAAGNSGQPGMVDHIRPHLDDPAPIVRAMAVWALGRLLDGIAFADLRDARRAAETDPAVRAEWILDPEAPMMRTYYEHGFGTLESWPIDPEEATLQAVLTDLFENHWREIAFGPLIQGAAWEMTLEEPPRRLAMQDGYLTVDCGTWHFHLCIGPHQGSKTAPIDPDLARHRRTARAEFFRRINDDGCPDVWGVRLFNGADEQQITILLPNPFLSPEMKTLAQPDWSRLATWNTLRKTHLALNPDPRDRTGTRLIHG